MRFLHSLLILVCLSVFQIALKPARVQAQPAIEGAVAVMQPHGDQYKLGFRADVTYVDDRVHDHLHPVVTAHVLDRRPIDMAQHDEDYGLAIGVRATGGMWFLQSTVGIGYTCTSVRDGRLTAAVGVGYNVGRYILRGEYHLDPADNDNRWLAGLSVKLW